MKRFGWVMVLVTAIGLMGAAGAAARAPAVTATGHTDWHPWLAFDAPGIALLDITLATAPDRASSGRFFSENVAWSESLGPSSAAAGYWRSATRLDPGHYWVLLHAEPDDERCVSGSPPSMDPTCADGYSQLAELTIPEPPVRFRGQVNYVLGGSPNVELTLFADPLGKILPYNLCYRTKVGRNRCKPGTIKGILWTVREWHSQLVNTRNLGRRTTFVWRVGNRVVARRVFVKPRWM